MNKALFSLLVLFSSNFAFASEPLFDKEVFYVGEQEKFSGDIENCFVEATYSNDGSEVKLRSIVIDKHDDIFIGVDSPLAKYTDQKEAYVFSKYLEDTNVEALELNASEVKSPQSLVLFLNDESHIDRLDCSNLVELKQSIELDQVQIIFNHFSDFLKEHKDEEKSPFEHKGHDHGGHKH